MFATGNALNMRRSNPGTASVAVCSHGGWGTRNT
jgi:hypothetical protein